MIGHQRPCVDSQAVAVPRLAKDFDELDRLTLDGSSEVHRILASHIDYDGEWLDPFMTDKFTNQNVPGIWVKGFIERRWEHIPLLTDKSGKLQVSRPILDLHLSWVDDEENLLLSFDTVLRSNGFNNIICCRYGCL